LAFRLESIDRLNPYSVTARYPDGIEDLSPKDAHEAVKLAEMVQKEVKRILKK
jgi:HEPN domain-containing protein